MNCVERCVEVRWLGNVGLGTVDACAARGHHPQRYPGEPVNADDLEYGLLDARGGAGESGA
ncbi:hypothetical protein OG604_47510 [Streptomyces sp. NBC_01231]|nr:hypothetical protein OG604_47510 [Streptomyces sp. NBC_01231]